MIARLARLLAAALPLLLPLSASGSEFVIRQSGSTLEVTGTLSSAAHREMLEAAARNRLPDLSVTFDLHGTTTPPPPGWSLVTLQALTSVAALDEARISVTAVTLHLQGLQLDGWPAARASLERSLLPDMNLVDETQAARSSDSFSRLCRRQFDAAIARGQVGFRLSSVELSPASLPLLDALVEILADCPQARLQVIGHTDASGSDAVNRAISESRAAAVVRYLQERGIAAGRLQATGMGSAEPLTAGETRAERARNRRIEFRIELPNGDAAG